MMARVEAKAKLARRLDHNPSLVIISPTASQIRMLSFLVH